MLRLNHKPIVTESDNILRSQVNTQLGLEPSDPVSKEIYRDFADPYLELNRVLFEAAGLEHLLMIQYIYAAFSIREEYAAVRGTMNPKYYMDIDASNLLGVAVEEMQHLRYVNEFLCDIGGAPNLEPQQYPYVSDIYPFEIDLNRLTQFATAQYLYIEAYACALDPKCSTEPLSYIEDVYRVLGQEVPYNHLGSLYNYIIKIAGEVKANPPDFLQKRIPPIRWEYHINNMRSILLQGESDHYLFFKSVFTASHPGFHGLPVWTFSPDDPRYPSYPLSTTQTTAYENQENEIKDPTLRKIAWLSDLHYWILLSLLDVSFRVENQKDKYKAVNNMTMALYTCGIVLAKQHLGLPFDNMSWLPAAGRDNLYSLQIIKLMVEEAQDLANETDVKNILQPAGFNYDVYASTLDSLLSPV